MYKIESKSFVVFEWIDTMEVSFRFSLSLTLALFEMYCIRNDLIEMSRLEIDISRMDV
jgi:hypothetical protein